MKDMTEGKAIFTVIFSLISSVLGILTVPVILMVTCNVLDYVTGIVAAPSRGVKVNSEIALKGLVKKVCMWLLVVVGAIIDELIKYASDTAGFMVPFTFLVACIVAIWIICNEIISILENLKDIGVPIPGFLGPIVENIRSQAEHTVEIEKEEGEK